ncbi:hypothetical protein CVT24_007835, partial [Panaeolus cyanescens]
MTATTPHSSVQSVSAGGSARSLRSRIRKTDAKILEATPTTQPLQTPTNLIPSIIPPPNLVLPSSSPVNGGDSTADLSNLSPLSPVSDTIQKSPDSVKDVFNTPYDSSATSKPKAPLAPIAGRKRQLVVDNDEDNDAIEWTPSPPSKRHNSSDDGHLDGRDIGHNEKDVNGQSSPTLYSGSGSSNDEAERRDYFDKNNIAKRLFAPSPADSSPIKSESNQPRLTISLPGRAAGRNSSMSGTATTTNTSNSVASTSNNSANAVVPLDPSPNSAKPQVNTLSPHLFTDPRKVPMWSKSVKYDNSGETAFIVTYVPSSNPWCSGSMVDLMDPDLTKLNAYVNLPAYPLVQFAMQSVPPNNDVIELDDDGHPIRHAMSLKAWDQFGLSMKHAAKFITFTRNKIHVNPSRDSVLTVMALSYSNEKNQSAYLRKSAPKTQFFAVEREDPHRQIVFWSLGVITSSFITQPCSEQGRPAYRGVHAVLQQWEKERMGAFFSMIFRNVSLIAQMDGNSAFVFQTRFRSKSYSQANIEAFSGSSHSAAKSSVGKMAIPS